MSDLHMEVKAALMGEDYEKLKNWQRDSYHKQMIGGFKETKEADDSFRKAQKPWAKKLKEVCELFSASMQIQRNLHPRGLQAINSSVATTSRFPIRHHSAQWSRPW